MCCGGGSSRSSSWRAGSAPWRPPHSRPPHRPAHSRPPVPAPVLTTVNAIRALTQDEAARAYPVRVRATVTHIDELAHVTLVIHDGQLGQFVMPPLDLAAVPAWAELRRGDLVDIEGRTERGGFAPNIRPSAIRRLGARRHAARPGRLRSRRCSTGRYDCAFVEIDGIIQRTWVSSDPKMRTLFADVAYEDGVVRASFWDYTAADLRAAHRRARPAARQHRDDLRIHRAAARRLALRGTRRRDRHPRAARRIPSRCRRARSAASTTTTPPAR